MVQRVSAWFLILELVIHHCNFTGYLYDRKHMFKSYKGNDLLASIYSAGLPFSFALLMQFAIFESQLNTLQMSLLKKVSSPWKKCIAPHVLFPPLDFACSVQQNSPFPVWIFLIKLHILNVITKICLYFNDDVGKYLQSKWKFLW